VAPTLLSDDSRVVQNVSVPRHTTAKPTGSSQRGEQHPPVSQIDHHPGCFRPALGALPAKRQIAGRIQRERIMTQTAKTRDSSPDAAPPIVDFFNVRQFQHNAAFLRNPNRLIPRSAPGASYLAFRAVSGRSGHGANTSSRTQNVSTRSGIGAAGAQNSCVYSFAALLWSRQRLLRSHTPA